MHPSVRSHLDEASLSPDRARRMVDGLRILQDVAREGKRPITYKAFAARLQPGLAAVATAYTLEDIATFCNAAGWPNVTCFVVSTTTGVCSPGFTRTSDQDPAVARDQAWLTYAAYRNGPLVDGEV